MIVRPVNPDDYPSYFKKGSNMIINLKNVRLSFADAIFEAKKVNGEGKAAFSCSFIFPPDHPCVAEIKAIQADARANGAC